MKTATNPTIATKSNPRLLAVEAVVRVARDKLPLALTAQADLLQPRDRALAFEIAFGTMRYLSLLDAILASCIARPIANKRHFLRGVLRTALYQARYMRIPDRAAVNEAVEMLKLSPEKAHCGFVNAVLRKAVKVDPDKFISQIKDKTEALALEYAHPVWLVERWLKDEPHKLVVARLAANNTPPTLALRTNTLKIESSALLAALDSVGAQAAPNTPDAILLSSGGGVEELAGFSEGWFAVQDQAAQWVSRFLQPKSGEHILDACAAPGGKTAHLAALANGKIDITAVEKYPSRIKRLQDNLKRLQIDSVTIRQGDVSKTELLAGEMFDKILLDAPCSGTGIIRRHPEIKWRRKAQDIDNLVKEQRAILEAVAKVLRPGGVLLYATCSVESEENEKQIANFLANHKDWRRQPIEEQLDLVADELITKQGDFHVEPGQLGMDGFYAARLTRLLPD
ncbi:MAG: 16S rRNA (cytosine(967)-C(5))-methyltransferase RsmB [Magnetococcales bacterium]|nr:16S rRNA (cytosine(967)-C(5))-methyltransferase RsmB [Magnetococcales bacterium]